MSPIVSFAIITGETSAGKTKRYLQLAGIALALCLLAGRIIPGLIWLLYIGLAGSVAELVWLLLLSSKSTFVLDGSIDFYESELHVQELRLPLTDLQRVEAHFTLAKGEGAGTNHAGSSGNQLLLVRRDTSDLLRFTVFVKSRAERVALDGLLRHWRQQGLAVVSDVF